VKLIRVQLQSKGAKRQPAQVTQVMVRS